MTLVNFPKHKVTGNISIIHRPQDEHVSAMEPPLMATSLQRQQSLNCHFPVPKEALYGEVRVYQRNLFKVLLPGQLFTLRFPGEDEIVDLLLVTHQDRSEIIVELKEKEFKKNNK